MHEQHQDISSPELQEQFEEAISESDSDAAKGRVTTRLNTEEGELEIVSGPGMHETVVWIFQN